MVHGGKSQHSVWHYKHAMSKIQWWDPDGPLSSITQEFQCDFLVIFFYGAAPLEVGAKPELH
jgi:hypothetical protein